MTRRARAHAVSPGVERRVTFDRAVWTKRSRSATAASSSARTRKLLVAAQFAAVVVLLTAAGLFIRSFTALLRLDLGFDPRGVLTFSFGFSEEKHDTKEMPGIVKSKARGSISICRTASRRIRSSTSWFAFQAIRWQQSRR